MIIRTLNIRNFRGIREADLVFSRHVLFVGPNNVGKSTVLEALDLVLGPERLARQSAIQEHDFHGGKYLSDTGEPIEITVEATLTNLSDEAQRAFRTHLEWWDNSSDHLATGDEAVAATVNKENHQPALRVRFRGAYDKEEDEFKAESFFVHPPVFVDEEPERFGRREKRLCGFLFLRSLRTGSRALSLEKGSLLDIVLHLKNVQAGGMWEEILAALRAIGPSLGQHAGLREVLDGIEDRIQKYTPLVTSGQASQLYVTDLTREHLRRTVSFFLKCAPSETLVPFQHSGSGTVNILVLALLTFIADLKESVIFAMEEPEIAIPPYTQRRIVEMIRTKSTQCLLTSHSPYVAERFVPEELVVLQRGAQHRLVGTPITTDVGIKKKNLQREFRMRFAEGVLSRGIVAVEGVTEQLALPVASERLAAADYTTYTPLDVLGVTVIDVGGDGSLEAIGQFFKALGVRTYAFIDKPKSPELAAKVQQAFDHVVAHDHTGFENLLSSDVPLDIIQAFLSDAKNWNDFPRAIARPGPSTGEAEMRKYVADVLISRKGEGYGAHLLRMCPAEKLPRQLTEFFRVIAADLTGGEQMNKT